MRAFLSRLRTDLEKRAGLLNQGPSESSVASVKGTDNDGLYGVQRTANAARASADLPLAESLYLEILQTNGNFVPAWLGLGLTLLELERFDEARRAFEIVRNLRPDEVDGYYLLGVAEMNLGHTAVAVQNWRDALQVQRDFLPALARLVPILVQTDPKAAEHLCRAAVSLAPRVAEFHLLLALTCAEMERSSEAIEEFQACLELDPSVVEARLNLARLFNELGDGIHAMEEAQRLIAIAPDLPEAKVELERAIAVSKATGAAG